MAKKQAAERRAGRSRLAGRPLDDNGAVELRVVPPPGDGITHLKDLVADPDNAREHTPRNIGLIADALQEVGAARSIVIDEHGRVLAGNGVVEAAAQVGIERVRVIEARGDEIIAVQRTGLTDDQKRRLAIYDNRAAELSKWSPEVLRAIQAQDPDLLKAAWHADELAAIFATLPGSGVTEGETPADDVPEPRETDIVRGDLFQVGDHLLLCGDSRNAADVQRVLGSAAADLVMTSPPYNCGIGYEESTDDNLSPADYEAFLRPIMRNAAAVLAPGRAFAWNVGVSRKTMHHRQVLWLEEAGLDFWRDLVWLKTGVPYPIYVQSVKEPRARSYNPNYQHEMIVLMTKGALEPGEAIQPDNKYQHDVWTIPQYSATVDLKTVGAKKLGFKVMKGHTVKEHPAAYPVEVPRAVMTFLTAPGERVLDPFVGAGTTIIAGEQTGRRVHGIEIEPLYCQTTIDRWERFTSRKAVKIGTAQEA